MKKMTMKHFQMTMTIMKKNDKTQQILKLYVLHVMIETTVDPKIICSAVHLSKICTKKNRIILLQKRIKERDGSANSSKYIPPKYICKSASNSNKKEKTN